MVTLLPVALWRRGLTVLLFAMIAPSAAMGVSKAMTDSGRRGGVPLALVRDVPLPGGTTRFDYASVDTKGRKLYVAHLGDSTLDVVDLDTLHVVAVVPRIADVHGVALAADRGRVYATATGDNELVTIESTTNYVIARTPTGDFPDDVAYDPDHALLYVSDKNAGSITVVSADTGKVTDTIKVAAETGNVAYDSAARLVYAAARTPDALVAIDPTSSKITTRIRLPGCRGAHGVFIDAATNRAFVACERNARLVTVDLTRRTETARSPVGRGPDVLAYDASLRRLYVAAESGDVAVFALSSRTPKKLGQSHVADAAHSVAVDQATDRVFLPLADIRGRPVLRVMRPT
jgi:DNA-binding beta-propeller fold protein YncE